MATRRPLEPLLLPPYSFEHVPMANRNLQDSVIVKLNKREKWLSHLSSMLLLCNEAAYRRTRKLPPGSTEGGGNAKPLGLEYMADRLDTDDPIWGYQIRTLNEGWLQGFITMTTFTVWQRNFRWDSRAPENGIVLAEMEGKAWDKDNILGRELERQPRSGDPDGEGIIWPTVAELSLLGGLGCGRAMLQLAIEELEDHGQYDYLVCQATDNAVSFYESMGFIRVGAVARYRDEQRRVHLEKGGGGDSAGRMNRKKRGYEEMEGSSGGGGATAPPAVRFSSPKAGRPKSGTARGADLPEWLRDKRFRFFVGSDKSTHKKQSTALKVQSGGGGRSSSSSSSQQPSSSAPHKGAAKKGGGQAPQKAPPKGGAHGVQRAPGKGEGSSYGKAPHTAGGHASSSSAARQPAGPSAPGSGTGQPLMHPALRGVTPQEGAFIMYVESAWQAQLEFRLFQIARMQDGTTRAREWRAARELGDSAGGMQRRFLPQQWRMQGPPLAQTARVVVVFKRSDARHSHVEYLEVVNERASALEAHGLVLRGGGGTKIQSYGSALSLVEQKVALAKQQLAQQQQAAQARAAQAEAAAAAAAAGPPARPATIARPAQQSSASAGSGSNLNVNWEDHSPANVAKRQEMGFVAYCHWTFPEQSVDDIYPSYMMARRLKRGTKPPVGGMCDLVMGKRLNNLPPVKATLHVPAPALAPGGEDEEDPSLRPNMVNKVVKIPGREDFEYYYVLHYIRDMHWCHVVPMRAQGVFQGSTVRAGRPRYKLVPEGEGRELDLPASMCIMATAFSVSKTLDADKETWDIVEEGEAEEYTRLLAEEKRKGRKSEGIASQPAPPQSSANTSSLWMQACERSLRKLLRHRSAWPFIDPVDPVELNIPDYLTIIKEPMDLGTVRDKLAKSEYESAEPFVKDVRQTFLNATIYNPQHDRVHQLALAMSDCFERDWAKEAAKLEAKGIHVPPGKPTTAVPGGEAGSEASGSQPHTPSQDHKPFESSSGGGMYQYQHGTNIIPGSSKGPATYQHGTNTAHVSSTGTATYQHGTNTAHVSSTGTATYQHGTNTAHVSSTGTATYQHGTNTAHVSSTGTATYQHGSNIIPGSHQHKPEDGSRMGVRDQSSSAWGTGGASGVEGQYGSGYEGSFVGPTETEPSPYVWGGGDDELIGNPDDGASTLNGGLPAGLNSMGVGDLYDFDQPHHSTYL